MLGIDEQRAYYNELWAAREYANPMEFARLLAVMRLLARVLPRMTGAPRICDLGCGSGWITAMAGNVGPALGIDLSDVTELRRKYPYCEFLTANAVEWNPAPHTFDIILSVEVIEHIEYSRQADYLSVAHRALRPGGYLILTTPSRRAMNAISGGGRRWSNQPIEDWLSTKELRSLLARTGFHAETITSVVPGIASKGIYRIVNSTRVNRFFRAVGLQELWTSFILREKLGLHLVVLAERRDNSAAKADGRQ